MPIVSLFIVAPNWEPCELQSTKDDWVNPQSLSLLCSKPPWLPTPHSMEASGLLLVPPCHTGLPRYPSGLSLPSLMSPRWPSPKHPLHSLLYLSPSDIQTWVFSLPLQECGSTGSGFFLLCITAFESSAVPGTENNAHQHWLNEWTSANRHSHTVWMADICRPVLGTPGNTTALGLSQGRPRYRRNGAQLCSLGH